MSLSGELSLRTADLDDVPAILELRRGVGWAAHEWALRLAIAPPGSRCFVVESPDGRVVGVGSGVAYGPLGFVGNMIVADEHRRQGVGGVVLDAVVQFLQEAGCTRLELFATEQGRPLYARHGFDHIEPGSRVRLPRPTAAPPLDFVVTDADRDGLEALVAYDTPRFGGERRHLLEAMLGDRDRPTLVATRGGDVVGYGWLRPDDDRIGPWMADEPIVAAAILAEAYARLPDRAELTANVPMSNRRGVEWLRGLGVEPDPWDGRMACGAPIPRREESIYGNTVGALG